MVRKDRRGRVKLAVPADIRHVRSADHVLNHAPLAFGFVQQRHHTVVKRSGLLRLGVDRVSIIDWAAVGPARRAQQEGPVVLHLQVIDLENSSWRNLFSMGTRNASLMALRSAEPLSGVYGRL